MAKLYFRYGAMSSSKTANALMTRFNYEERGQQSLLVKPRLVTRDGDHMVSSRIGLTHPCIYFDEMQQMTDEQLAVAGIPAGLVRLSCGLEDKEDLLADLQQALAGIAE